MTDAEHDPWEYMKEHFARMCFELTMVMLAVCGVAWLVERFTA